MTARRQHEELASAKARAHQGTSTVSSDGEGRSRTSDDIDVAFFGNSRIVKPKTEAEAGADGGGHCDEGREMMRLVQCVCLFYFDSTVCLMSSILIQSVPIV